MDASIALVEFSKRGERVWSKPFDDAQILVVLNIWHPRRLALVEQARHATEFMQIIVRQAIDVGKLQAGQSISPTRGTVDLDGLLTKCDSGQQKRAKFPTSKAHISADSQSFRLIFGQAIISRNGLEAWMLSGTRARGTLTLKRT